MAVFWFGWGKKLKNVFTKKEADQYYLQKNSNQLQQVSGLVDFMNNIACKRNGYVDYVDTNSPTSMINKRYLDNAINSIQVGRSIKVGNTIFQTEKKNIQGGNVPTRYSPASGFSITNLVIGKLYFVEVYYKSGTYDRAPIFYMGTTHVSMYLPQIATTILFGNYLNQSLEVYADKPISNLLISFKEVIITS